MILFREYPKRPSFPCFPGQTDFAVVLENYLAVVLANNAKWLLIRTLVWIDSRIHSVGRLSEKDYLKDIFNSYHISIPEGQVGLFFQESF